MARHREEAKDEWRTDIVYQSHLRNCTFVDNAHVRTVGADAYTSDDYDPCYDSCMDIALNMTFYIRAAVQ